MKIEKIENDDIIIEQKHNRYIQTIDQEDIEITWNNLNNFLLHKLTNLEELKIQRIAKTSSFGMNGIKHYINFNDIYSIKKIEDGKTGIRGFIYIKEFKDFNGEFNPNKFNIVTDLKVVFVENKNKLCLIDSNNNILFEKKYEYKPFINQIQEDVFGFYIIAKKILEFDYITKEVYFSDEKEKEDFYNIIYKRILIKKEKRLKK